jgi:hypothetical protein
MQVYDKQESQNYFSENLWQFTMILCEAESEYLILYSGYDTDWTTEEPGFDSLNNMKFIVTSEVYKSVTATI